jgi:hypothetical protein
MLEILLVTAILTVIGYFNYKAILTRSKNLMDLLIGNHSSER